MKKPTQKELILQYLINFGSITTMQAFADLGITRLAARISDLKDEGYVFRTENVHRISRYGKKIKFKKYTLELGELINE